MILSALVGVVMNVLLVDNATGQNLSRAIMFGSKVHNMKKQDVKEEVNQIAKDIITEDIKIGIHNDQ